MKSNLEKQNEEQAAFEKWALEKGYDLSLQLGGYSYYSTLDAWNAWKARAELKSEADAVHHLPIGSVVEYYEPDTGQAPVFDRARMIVVEHSRDCGNEPLYMVAKNAIAPPPDKYKFYSRVYLTYRLHAGGFKGNVPISLLRDTGERIKVEPFKIESWMEES